MKGYYTGGFKSCANIAPVHRSCRVKFLTKYCLTQIVLVNTTLLWEFLCSFMEFSFITFVIQTFVYGKYLGIFASLKLPLWVIIQGIVVKVISGNFQLPGTTIRLLPRYAFWTFQYGHFWRHPQLSADKSHTFLEAFTLHNTHSVLTRTISVFC